MQRGNQVILNWPAPRRNARPGACRVSEELTCIVWPRFGHPLTLKRKSSLARDAHRLRQLRADHQARHAQLHGRAFAERPRASLRRALRELPNQRAAFPTSSCRTAAASAARPSWRAARSHAGRRHARWRRRRRTWTTRRRHLLGYKVYRATRAQNEPARRPQCFAAHREELRRPEFQFWRGYSYVVRARLARHGRQPRREPELEFRHGRATGHLRLRRRRA